MNTTATTSKTTIELNPKLLFDARLKALQEGKTLKQIIEDSLVMHLYTLDPRPQHLKNLANQTIGSLKDTKNPIWRDKTSIKNWQAKLRQEWPS